MKKYAPMGIPQLNHYLQNNTKNGINEISLNELRGKTIVVDTSIYLYKYLSEEALVEGFYHLITKLRQFSIIPLFVFDGKPPAEKQNELIERKQRKEKAKHEYDNLLQKYEKEQNPRKKITIKTSLENLKRQFVKVTHDDIIMVKSLMHSYGVSYIDANGEADVLCAAIVNMGKAYACLSEDMDMFVYGCKQVLRYLSLLNSTVVKYDTSVILNDLGMTYEDFKDICIITGCDYVKKHQRCINTTIEIFKRYCEERADEDSFHEWVIDNTDYFNEAIEFDNISELFNLDKYDHDFISNIQIFNSVPNNKNLIAILSKHGFIFV
jgi:flap endonuclease-1